MGTWTFDPLHTQVEFSAKHFGMMTVRGNFSDVTATGDIYPDQPERSKVDVTIRTASIRTHNEQRDNDLRSSYFLEAEKYPTITFKSTKIEKKGEDRGTMTGDLTIKGTTKPVTLKVAKYGEFTDPQIRRGDHDQPQGLWHELRCDGQREIRGQPRYPDQHRGRACRGGEKGGGRHHE